MNITFEKCERFVNSSVLSNLLTYARIESPDFADGLDQRVAAHLLDVAVGSVNKNGWGELAYIDDEPVGFSILDVRGDRVMGGLTYVIKGFRGQGIGTQLRVRMLNSVPAEIKTIPYKIKKTNKSSKSSIEIAAKIANWGIQSEFSFDPHFDYYALLRK